MEIMKLEMEIFWFLFGFVFLVGLAGMLLLAIAPATYTLPMAATGNPLGTKTGQAAGHTYFFVLGDSSNANIVEACRNGGITKISTVDYKMKNFVFIRQTYTVVVTGD